MTNKNYLKKLNKLLIRAKNNPQEKAKIMEYLERLDEEYGSSNSNSMTKSLGGHPSTPSKAFDYENDGGYTSILMLSLISFLSEVFFIIFAYVMFK